MSNLKAYKGYTATLEVDAEAGLIHGRVLGLRDVVSFDVERPREVVTAFKEAVDDYLDYCRKLGREPEKPYSGTFVVRMTPEEHRTLALAAAHEGYSINAFVKEAVRRATAG